MLTTPGKSKVQPSSVSQSTTLSSGGEPMSAERAIDGNPTTGSHTKCKFQEEVWYKMNFDAVHCFTEVVIIQSSMNDNLNRMQDTQVIVLDAKTGTESLCGVLKVSNIKTIEGQTYRIPCDLKCGDEVKLTVQHKQEDYWKKACIHMNEITAYELAAGL